MIKHIAYVMAIIVVAIIAATAMTAVSWVIYQALQRWGMFAGVFTTAFFLCIAISIGGMWRARK